MPDVLPQPEPAHSPARVWVFFIFAALLAVAIIFHLPYLDGPWYAHWDWRHTASHLVHPAMFVAGLPLLLAMWLHEAKGVRAAWLLPLLVLSHAGFELVSISLMNATSFSLDKFIAVVAHYDTLSYFMDAAERWPAYHGLRAFLSAYPDMIPSLNLHSRTKPPGPVLFFVPFIQSLGVTRTAALVGGLTVAAIAALVSPGVYFLCSALRMTTSASFYASVSIILTPSAVMFLPSLDAIYMLATCAFVGCWAHALRSNRFKWSIAFGFALFVASFMAYNMLILGAFIIAYAFVAADVPKNRKLIRFVRHALVVALTTVVLYVLLNAMTGFNPIATFLAAYHDQSTKPAELNRAYRWTILFDQTDFALGCGWLAIALVIYFFLRKRNEATATPTKRYGYVAVGQIALAGFSGFLPGETARVWAFLVPLLMPIVGAELSHWTKKQRAWAFVVAWVILMLLIQHLFKAEVERMPLA